VRLNRLGRLVGFLGLEILCAFVASRSTHLALRNSFMLWPRLGRARATLGAEKHEDDHRMRIHSWNPAFQMRKAESLQRNATPRFRE